jgi:hypothetical protein
MEDFEVKDAIAKILSMKDLTPSGQTSNMDWEYLSSTHRSTSNI